MSGRRRAQYIKSNTKLNPDFIVVFKVLDKIEVNEIAISSVLVYKIIDGYFCHFTLVISLLYSLLHCLKIKVKINN